MDNNDKIDIDSQFGPWAAKYGPLLGLRLDDVANLKVAFVAYMVGAMEMRDVLQKQQMSMN